MLQMWFAQTISLGIARGKVRDTNDQRTREQLRCYLCNKLGHISGNCSGKLVWGQGIITTLTASQSLKGALPEVGVRVDGLQCSVLINTGCS